MARITVIPPEEATGELAELHGEIERSRGRIAAVHQIASLNPESIRAHMDLYRVSMFGRSTLSRAEREMMAVVVSATNGCAYCIAHHAEALAHFWKDRARVEELAQKRIAGGLSERETALCRYASLATTDPGEAAIVAVQDRMRAAGIDDRGILDATLVVAYFNFVNRIVLTLGVELEPNAGGYRYE